MTALQHDPDAPDNAVQAALAADAGVQAVAVGGVHWGEAEDGVPCPLIVLNVASDLTTYYLGMGSMDVTISYLVRGVANTRAGANAALQAADVVLQDRKGQPSNVVVPGYQVVSLRREGGGQRYTDSDGFFNAAAYYALALHKEG